MKKALCLVVLIVSLAVCGFAQTAAPQFTVNLNFLIGSPFGQASAMDAAFTNQFTTNLTLRGDVITMPGAGYSGFLGGPQYSLCGIKALENLLAPTSLSCGKFQPYIGAAAGLGEVATTSTKTWSALARGGANYDPTGSGKFTLNLFELGYLRAAAGQAGVFAQTGIQFGLGTSASATQAKQARMARSNAKKLKKLNEAIQKANKG